MPNVELIEVGPRDGLQNEAVILPPAARAALAGALADAGLRRIEVASFVDPARVPQMAGAEEVAALLPDREGVTYVGLVLNKKGAIRAAATKLHEFGYVVPLSESFGMRNQGRGVQDCVDAAAGVAAIAREHGRRFQVTLSVAFACPFDGDTDPRRVAEVARQLAALAPHEIALADTIGAAGPAEVEALCGLVAPLIAPVPLRVHFHNTRNTGLANVWAALRAGVRRIDASVGGLGGCPFAPGAAGNVASEDVVYLLDRSGFACGADGAALASIARGLEAPLARRMASAMAHAPAYDPQPWARA